jgi:hypothetical protein
VVGVSLRVSRAPGQDFNVLTHCPACGYEFTPEERRHVHLSDHGPADFGLAPLGEIPADHDAPLFGGDGR